MGPPWFGGGTKEPTVSDSRDTLKGAALEGTTLERSRRLRRWNEPLHRRFRRRFVVTLLA
jgi:hypothetical protein